MSGYTQAVTTTVAIPSRARATATAVPWLLSIVLPSLGSVIFAVTLFNVLFLSAGTRTLFRDSDTGWHVRNGEAIIRNSAVPTTDAFSYTHAGREWFAWEWLADIILGGAHLAAGPAGVALLSALIIALIGWGAWRLALSLGGNLFLATAALLPLLGTTTIHWLARPHLFSWMIGLSFIAIAERHRRGLAPARSLYLLPLLSCLWANLHGSFLLGTALLLIYAVGEWLRGEVGRVAGRRFALASLASLLASFINPYGWRVHEHIFAYLQNTYLMDRISEFRSFSFHSPGAIYVELFLLLAAVGTVVLFREGAYGPGLLSLALLHMSLYSARHLPTYAILMAPIFVAAISRHLETLPRLERALSYSRRVWALDQQVSGAVASGLAVLVMVLLLQAPARAGLVGFDPQKFPVRAAEFLARQGTNNRVFARDSWGGYLIYRFDGQMKVFIDGRSDFYGEDWLETCAQVIEVQPGWDRLLDAFAVDTVLLPPGHALASALRLHPDWRPVYADSVAAVFERKG
ncbi:MAG: hypothetical protein EXQ56_03230 [Acidobacteria bacterium]|nr:hypothetical protein [Acidobacteriota bacterium]